MALLRQLERALEEADRGVELVDQRVGAAERVRPARIVGEIDAPHGAGLFQPGDRLTRLSFPVGELPETGERAGLLVARRRLLERLAVQPGRLLALVEAEADLGLDQDGVLVVPLVARCEVVLAHAEAPAHLAQELKRRNAVARLDAGDVRGRAARERELALAQTRAFAGLTQPPTDLDWVVDMC